MLRIERNGCAVGRLALHDLVPPHVAIFDHRHRRGIADTLHHQHVLDGAGPLDRSVAGRLEIDSLATAPAAVSGDEQLGLGVVDATGQGIGREAAEDDGVWRADPSAGQHGDGQLRDHGHVDGDSVTRAHTKLLERVSGLLHLAMEVGERQRPFVTGLADPVEGDLVAVPGLDVPIDAVLRDVELAALEPLRERRLPGERPGERLVPAQLLPGQVRPEGLVVGIRGHIEVRTSVGLGLELRARRECLPLAHEILDLRATASGALLFGHAVPPPRCFTSP